MLRFFDYETQALPSRRANAQIHFSLLLQQAMLMLSFLHLLKTVKAEPSAICFTELTNQSKYGSYVLTTELSAQDTLYLFDDSTKHKLWILDSDVERSLQEEDESDQERLPLLPRP
jgi:hypothetical protein